MIACFLMGLVVGYSIVNTIPAVFLGAPDESAIFMTLPGQKYLMCGRGREAAILTGIGGLGGLLFLAALAPIASPVFSAVRTIVTPHLFWILALVLAHGAPSQKPGPHAVAVGKGVKGFRLRSAIVQLADSGADAILGSAGSECSLDHCVLIAGARFDGPVAVRNCAWLRGRAVAVQEKASLRNAVLPALKARHSCEVSRCTIAKALTFAQQPNAVRDSIVGQIAAPGLKVRIDYCDVYGKPPFLDAAKPAKRCFSADPQFINVKAFDYRLRRASPCRKRASDGGDLGCRYTREMVDLIKLAFELRKKGMMKF